MPHVDGRPCACNVCAVVIREGDAQADDLCPFCASTCYPLARLPAGKSTRVRFTHPTRVLLHEAFDPDFVSDSPVRTQDDLAEQMLVQAAEQLGQVVRPHVRKAVKQAGEAVRKVLLGR